MQIDFDNEDQINENLTSHMSRLDVLYNMEQGFTAKDRNTFGDILIYESLKLANEGYQDRVNGKRLREYIVQEFSEGKTEFRIAIQDTNHLVIQPLGKDGQTIDIYLT